MQWFRLSVNASREYFIYIDIIGNRLTMVIPGCVLWMSGGEKLAKTAIKIESMRTILGNEFNLIKIE